MFADKINLYRQYRPLQCAACSKDLLLHPKDAHVVYVKKKSSGDTVVITDFYWACKGSCEHSLNIKQSKDALLSREEIGELTIPYNFINFVLGNLQVIHNSHLRYEDSAFENMKFFISRVAQFAVREQYEDEIKKLLKW